MYRFFRSRSRIVATFGHAVTSFSIDVPGWRPYLTLKSPDYLVHLELTDAI